MPPPRARTAKGKMDDVVFRRARHVIGEIERTVARRGTHPRLELAAAGELMYASHVPCATITK